MGLHLEPARYVCMYVCMYACMHACMLIPARYVCMYVRCMYACMHACMHVCMYVLVCVCMYVRMYVCTDVCTYVCMYVYASHIHIHVCVCARACVRGKAVWTQKALHTPLRTCPISMDSCSPGHCLHVVRRVSFAPPLSMKPTYCKRTHSIMREHILW